MLVLYNNHVCTGIKIFFFYLFFILSIICYIIDVFSFSFIFFPLKGAEIDADIETKWLADLLQ